jgi:hypothetical protein
MLTHADVELLEFEETHPRHTGLKADAIRHRLQITPTRYYQRLRWLAGQRAALDAYPRVCARVQRSVDRRREADEVLQRQLRALPYR